MRRFRWFGKCVCAELSQPEAPALLQRRLGSADDDSGQDFDKEAVNSSRSAIRAERRVVHLTARCALILQALFSICAAQQARFDLVGLAPGMVSGRVHNLSQDGSVAVGINQRSGADAATTGFTWTAQGGRVDAVPPVFQSIVYAYGISSNGSTITGYQQNTSATTDRRAFVRHGTDPVISLPLLSGYQYVSSGIYVSGDGLLVAGSCTTSGSPPRYQAFRWTAQSGLQGLGYAKPGDGTSRAYAVSRSGNAIVGESGPSSGATAVGFIWTQASGMRPLSGTIGSGGQAYGVNADGTVIVGDWGSKATYWDAAFMAHRIDPTTIGTSDASDTNDDGSVIVGYRIVGSAYSGFVWTQGGGLMSAAEYLARHIVPVPEGCNILWCTSISGDGSTIAGIAQPPGPPAAVGFVAHLGPYCCADFNLDGGIDGSDVSSFFSAWESGNSLADANEDGGVDGQDVAVFFGQWEAGSC